MVMLGVSAADCVGRYEYRMGWRWSEPEVRLVRSVGRAQRSPLRGGIAREMGGRLLARLLFVFLAEAVALVV